MVVCRVGSMGQSHSSVFLSLELSMRIIFPTVALFITLAFGQADEEKKVADFDQNTSGPQPVRKGVPERDQASFRGRPI